MNAEIENMARNFYGYGRWDAPYWFIGPEPGGENNDLRATVWNEMGASDLLDCKEFHDSLAETMRKSGNDPKSVDKVKKLFRESPEPAFQPTWRKLMLFLKAYRPALKELSDLRSYQRDFWGSVDAVRGKTCIIELSGLSFKSFRQSRAHQDELKKDGLEGEWNGIIQTRVRHICDKMRESKSKLELVVMYGFDAEEHWKKIAGPELKLARNRSSKQEGESVTIVYVQHPTWPPRRDKIPDCLVTDFDWVKLAEKTRGDSE